MDYRTADINPLGAANRYAYDARGNVTHRIDAFLYQTIRISDRNGEPVFEQKADGGTSRWTRNDFGRVESHTAVSGEISAYTYDEKAQCTRVVTSELGGPDEVV